MKGILFILSAPSGAGKTTISRKAVAEIPGLEMSVSATTRAPRPGERPGVDYHFLSREEFERRRDAGEFAEWARVHDHFYGTPKAPIENALASGRNMLLDIDVQGARQMKERYPEAVAVFVLPPSEEELARRLRGRGTDPEDVIRRRLERAKEEMKEHSRYDHEIVNRDVAESVRAFAEIVARERARVRTR
jgi:guanylate kinase